MSPPFDSSRASAMQGVEALDGLGYDAESASLGPAIETELLSTAPDWVVVGLVLAIAGCFVLANAILVADPRELIRQRLGQDRAALGSLRSQVFHRVQIGIGFLLLLGGFGLQLLGHFSDAPVATGFPILWVGATVALVFLLELLGWIYSRRMFRNCVRATLIESGAGLESDSKLMREIGELFGVQLLPDDTVQTYAARVRASVQLPQRIEVQEREPLARIEEELV